MSDLISILIPTRNRPLLARLAVDAALANADARSEVIVADNSDQPLDLPADTRLLHLPPPNRVLSMPDNWERALEAAQGDWTILLADKYMLAPGAIPALRRLTEDGHRLVKYGYAVLRQGLRGTETVRRQALLGAGGRLSLPAPGPHALLGSQAALGRFLASAEYPKQLPMLYTALAARSIVEDGRSRSGRYFCGSCPDVSSAVQLLASSTEYLATQLPVVLVQYPSDEPAWSTGASSLARGGLFDSYLTELGSELLVDPVEQSVSGAILETIRATIDARPDLRGHAVGWEQFARQAAREIEGLGPGRFRRHRALTEYLMRHGQGPRALWAQTRAAAGVHAPRWLKRVWTRGRPPEAVPATVESFVATRDEAFARAALHIRLGLDPSCRPTTGQLSRTCPPD